MTNPMTPKERVLCALRGEKPDLLPASPVYPGLFLADFYQAYYVEQYRRRTRGLSRYPLDHDEDTEFRAQALYQSYGVFKTRPDCLEISRGASRAWAERTDIVVEHGVLYYRDKASGSRLPMDQAPVPWGDAGLVTGRSADRDRWDSSDQFSSKEEVEARLPILSAADLLARGDLDLARKVVDDYGDLFFLQTILDTPFSDAYRLLGFQGLMLIQHDRPKLFHHLLARRLRQTQEEMAAWATSGIHGVFVEEAFTSADIISPRSYQEFVFEYDRPFFRHMRSLGLLSILYICGDALPRVNSMTQLDLDAVAFEESKKNFEIHIEDIVGKVDGRAAVFGNIDAVKFGIHATMDDMAAEVKRQARFGAEARGFVISTGSPFPLDTNPRQIDALVETAHSLPG